MNLKTTFSALDLPDVLCIQESHLTPKYQPSNPSQVIRDNRASFQRKRWWPHGLCQDVFKLSNIAVALHGNSNLEVLGIALHGFSIFNIYNPPPTP